MHRNNCLEGQPDFGTTESLGADALWNELRQTPPAAAPSIGPPSAGTPPASSDELAQLRIAASRALREQLERTQHELAESVEVNLVLEEKVCGLWVESSEAV